MNKNINKNLLQYHIDNLKNYGWCLVENTIPPCVLKLIEEEAITTENRFLKMWSEKKPHIKFNLDHPPLSRLRNAWIHFEKPEMRRYPLKFLITQNFHKFVII